MERTEIGTVTDAEHRYGIEDPGMVWYYICSGRSFRWRGHWVTLYADHHYPGTTKWIVEAVES